MTAAVAEALNTIAFQDFSRDQKLFVNLIRFLDSESLSGRSDGNSVCWSVWLHTLPSAACGKPRSIEVGPTRANASHISGEDGVP